jgi:hypothetical protein
MGWNDRLPEDPYIPTESYYERQEYEAWMEYLESQKSPENPAGGLSSQNIDPAAIPSTPGPNFMRRVLARVFGAEPQKPINKRDEIQSPF